jgi:hypothetical protein
MGYDKERRRRRNGTVHVVIYCTVIGFNLRDRLRCVGISNRQENGK